jgi:transcriptional regulator with XRE-family HTH domain
MVTGQMQTPSLGQKVRSLREQKEITLRELARRAEVSPSFVSDLEMGRRFPSPRNLRKLAGALGVAVSDLADLDHRQTLAALKRLLEKDPAWGELFVEIVRAASEDQAKPAGMLKRLKVRK